MTAVIDYNTNFPTIGKYRVEILEGGRKIFTGHFKTVEEAAKARRSWGDVCRHQVDEERKNLESRDQNAGQAY
tara:strand:+ start:1042 stop:1260 length:219 start_codon:yes stop_codon:yes gene_type:complete